MDLSGTSIGLGGVQGTTPKRRTTQYVLTELDEVEGEQGEVIDPWELYRLDEVESEQGDPSERQDLIVYSRGRFPYGIDMFNLAKENSCYYTRITTALQQ